MNKTKLFCLPYAGGSSTIFAKWEQYLAPGISLRAIEPAGRGRRLHEALYPDMAAAVDDIFNLVLKEVFDGPYALFGHSLGSKYVYKLALKIQETSLSQPVHLFFSGRRPPHVKDKNEKKFHLMNDTEFRQELINLGGTPPEFFEHPELLELFLPVLKNDFRLSEEEVEGDILPLNCNITVFSGKEDEQTPEQCDGWKYHTRKLCSIHYFNGGHFFIHHEAWRMIQLINHVLTGGR
jgi:medium-chain acyl-[acyl-carrier-protein] hydrolase